MARLILHIGMPKTGSSSIQTSLKLHLDDENFVYANLGGSNHGGVMFSVFSDDPNHWQGHRKANRSNAEIEQYNAHRKAQLINECKKIGDKTLIISGEAMYHMSKQSLSRMKRFFSKYVDDIQIIGYIRPPKSLMESSFQQLVKLHELGKLDWKKITPVYRRKLEKFDMVFGKDNVTLLTFSPRYLINKDVVMDFCSRLGIQFDKKHICRVNESLSKEATALLFAYNQENKNQPDLLKHKSDHLLIQALSGIKGTKLKFHNDLVKPILSASSNDIQWMEHRLGQSLKENTNEYDGAIRTEKCLTDCAFDSRNLLKKIISEKATVNTPSLKELAKQLDAIQNSFSISKGQNNDDIPIQFEEKQLEKLRHGGMGAPGMLRVLATSLLRSKHYHEALLVVDQALKMAPRSIKLLELKNTINSRLKEPR